MDPGAAGYGPSVDARLLVVVGSSWGGADALCRVLAALPPTAGASVVVAHHRRPGPSALAATLSRLTPWPVCDAEDKDPIAAGVACLAPGGYHLLIDGSRLALSTEGPVQHCRPSVDVLFESAADCWGSRVAGVILTGNNDDGAFGLARIAARGGIAVVQDPGTAKRAPMPAAAVASTPGATVLALDEIGPFLERLCDEAERAPIRAPIPCR